MEQKQLMNGPGGFVFPRIHRDEVTHLCIAGDGKTLVSSSKEGMLSWFDLSRKVCIKKQMHDNPICAVVAVPGGERLLAGFSDGNIVLMHSKSGEIDFDFELAASQNDAKSQAAPTAGSNLTAGVLSLEITPDGSLAVASTRDSLIHLLDLKQKSVAKKFKQSSPCSSFAVFPDGKRVFFGGNSRSILDITTGRETVRLGGRLALGPAAKVLCHQDGVRLLSLHPTIQNLPTASPESHSCIRVWYLKTEKTVQLLQLDRLSKSSMVLSPNGRFAFFGGIASGVGVWDIEEKKRLPDLGSGIVSSLVYYKDSIIAGTKTGSIFMISSGITTNTQVATPTRAWNHQSQTWEAELIVRCLSCFTPVQVSSKQAGMEIQCQYCHGTISLTPFICDRK